MTYFLATNRQALPRFLRAFILIIAPALSFASTGAAYRMSVPRIGHGLAILGAFICGPSIFLSFELLIIEVSNIWLLFIWSALELSIGKVIDSIPGTGRGLLILITLIIELVEPADPLPTISLVGLIFSLLGGYVRDVQHGPINSLGLH